MPVSYNFLRGVDLPSWHWLNQYPSGGSNPGTSNNYDGSRYIYWAIQSGSASAASTSQLWRFDTWTNGWQYLASLPTSGFSGMELEYDPVRNVIWVAIGNNTTTWYFFNLNTTALTLNGVTAQPYAFSAAMLALPAAANTWSALDHASDGDIPAQVTIRGNADDRKTGIAGAASTATSIQDTTAEFHAGLVGCYVRFTSGLLSGLQRVITAATLTTLTVSSFGSAPTAGDTFVIEVPGGRPDLPANTGTVQLAVIAGGTTTTVPVIASEGWPTNMYRDADVVFTSGALTGQRRRIASNTGSVLTLAGAVTGNPRTGPLGAAPAAGDTFRIIPSEDFLYYASITAALYRLDLAATTYAWSTLTAPPAAFGTGGQVMRTGSFAPFSLVAMRGSGTSTAWRYDIGLQTWTVLSTFWGQEVLTTGATTVRMPGRHRFFMTISGTQRCYVWNAVLGTLEPVTFMPYAAPSAYDGKRVRFIESFEGSVDWVYALRPGGQELFRIALEWNP
jgi:hypothetical protein